MCRRGARGGGGGSGVRCDVLRLTVRVALMWGVRLRVTVRVRPHKEGMTNTVRSRAIGPYSLGRAYVRG